MDSSQHTKNAPSTSASKARETTDWSTQYWLLQNRVQVHLEGHCGARQERSHYTTGPGVRVAPLEGRRIHSRRSRRGRWGSVPVCVHA